ncbi:MAG: F-box protein [Parachlamydiales bacterium]|nr:F-box protein [Parachlamydiales bacterium]
MSFISLDTTPTKIISSTIFSYCDANSLLKLERVSKEFKNFIEHHPLWDQWNLQENHVAYKETNETPKQAYFLNRRLKFLDKALDDAATNSIIINFTWTDFNIGYVFDQTYKPQTKREIIFVPHPDIDGPYKKLYSMRTILLQCAQTKTSFSDIENHYEKKNKYGGTIYSLKLKQMTPKLQNQIREFFTKISSKA